MAIAGAGTLEFITCLCQENNVEAGMRSQCAWQGERFPGKIVAVHFAELRRPIVHRGIGEGGHVGSGKSRCGAEACAYPPSRRRVRAAKPGDREIFWAGCDGNPHVGGCTTLPKS